MSERKAKRLTLRRSRSYWRRKCWQEARRLWSYHCQGLGIWWRDGRYHTTPPTFAPYQPLTASDYLFTHLYKEWRE